MVEREKLIAMVQGVQREDEDAVIELYTTFQKDIYYFIFKTVNDKELAEDLTQDTFMNILQNIHKLQEPAAFVNWSRQVAYSQCTAYFRKRHELLLDENEDGSSLFDTVEEERAEFIPDEALDQEDFKKTIHAMIDSLPPEQRSAILMRYYQELSVEEIAKIQGVPAGTVKSRLNYGRKAIKNAVDTYEKKSGVKLHCAGVLPILLWVFRGTRQAAGMSLTGKAAVATVAGIGKAAVAGEAVAEATSDVAKKAAKKGAKKGLAAIFKSTATKVVAGMTASAVITGGAVELAHSQKEKEEKIPTEPETAYTMEWLGYGKCTTYGGHRYKIVLTELDEEKIAGSIEVSYLYRGVYISDFSGTIQKNADEQQDDEENDQQENPEREYHIEFDKVYHHNTLGDFTTEEMNVLYNEEKMTIQLEYPFEVTLQRQMENEEPVYLLQNTEFSGMGADLFHDVNENTEEQFVIQVESMTKDSVAGSLQVSFQGEILHETAFTGRGYSVDAGYMYEIQLETARKGSWGWTDTYTVEYLWLFYNELDGFDYFEFRPGTLLGDTHDYTYQAKMERVDKTES